MQINVTMRYHPMSVKMVVTKSKRSQVLMRMWENGTLIHCWGEYKWCSSMEFPLKIKVELPYDPVIPPLGIHLEELKRESRRDTCNSIFIAALLPTARIWNQIKCPLMDE